MNNSENFVVAITTVVCAMLLTALVTALVTWGVARTGIATECKRLGGFYVGSSTFKCEEVKS